MGSILTRSVVWHNVDVDTHNAVCQELGPKLLENLHQIININIHLGHSFRFYIMLLSVLSSNSVKLKDESNPIIILNGHYLDSDDVLHQTEPQHRYSPAGSD